MEQSMKISSHQVRAAIEAYANRKQSRGPADASLAKAGTRASAAGLERCLNELPDQRDTLVHELRRKIRRGRYFVSSRDIVDALLGRLAADLLNQE